MSSSASTNYLTCVACGQLTRNSSDTYCVACAGLLTPLSPNSLPQQRAMLQAWLDQDTKERSEGWWVGGCTVAGVFLGVAFIFIGASWGAASILPPFYGGLMGALAGRYGALRSWERKRPLRTASRECTRLRRMLVAGVAAPVTLAVAIGVFGGHNVAWLLKRSVGALITALAG